jgi:hypothetical protein
MAVLRRNEGASAASIGWLRSALVTAQMAVSVLLVIGTAVLFEGFQQALRTARAEHLGDPVVVTLEAAARYARPAAGREYFRLADQLIAHESGVTSVAWTGTLPGGRPQGASVRLEPPPAGRRQLLIDTATPRGADLLKQQLTKGRPFGGQDGPLTCPVALVNEEASAQYFGGDAVGRALQDAAGRRLDIIGTVRPAQRPRGEPQGPALYLFERQSPREPSRASELRSFTVPIAAAATAAPELDVDVNVASSGYFAAIGAPITAGRGFEGVSAGGCDVAVVNREAAESYFGGRALGGAVIDVEGRRAEIIGVVDTGALRIMQRRADPMVYFPIEQRYVARMTMLAGTAAATPELLERLSRGLRGLPGGGAEPLAISLQQHLSRTSLGPDRIGTLLVAAAAVAALCLGLVGVFGVLSDTVVQKRREIALRLALGAQSWKIIGGVFRGGLRLAAGGAAAGLAASALLVLWLRHLNPGLAAPAAWMWLSCPVVLLAMVALASILPARWALSVDPLTITREN